MIYLHNEKERIIAQVTSLEMCEAASFLRPMWQHILHTRYSLSLRKWIWIYEFNSNASVCYLYRYIWYILHNEKQRIIARHRYHESRNMWSCIWPSTDVTAGDGASEVDSIYQPPSHRRIDRWKSDGRRSRSRPRPVNASIDFHSWRIIQFRSG